MPRGVLSYRILLSLLVASDGYYFAMPYIGLRSALDVMMFRQNATILLRSFYATWYISSGEVHNNQITLITQDSLQITNPQLGNL